MEKMATGLKLNYVISSQIDEALGKYCRQTGRTASDVIRQLLTEFVEGERTLSGPARPCTDSTGIRSNMILPAWMLSELDSKIASEGHGTRGAIISRLLFEFLEHRLGEEITEPVTINMVQEVYDQLTTRAKRLGKSLDEIVVEACRAVINGDING